MSANTEIEWADGTWNPVRGCSVVSPGCINCYAMKQAHRFSGEGKPYHGLTKLTERSGPQWTGKVVTDESKLLEPLSWRKPQRIFVNSMSDLFHEDIEPAFIGEVFGVMAVAKRHTFQVLTKRIERALELLSDPEFLYALENSTALRTRDVEWEWPLPNVWLGVSVENQHFADERIPLLLKTPAAVRFISAEPLLEAVNLRDLQPMRGKETDSNGLRPLIEWPEYNALNGQWTRDRMGYDGQALDWVIVGGESGPGARPLDLAWVRSIVEQCKAAGVACFVKQLGARPEKRVYCADDGARCDPLHGREQYASNPLDLKNRKGGDMAEFPADLQVREFPEAACR